MTQDISNYAEEVADISPSVAGMSSRTGRATMRWQLLDPENGGAQEVSPGDVVGAVSQILGYCASASPPGAVKLSRVLPYAHPLFPFLYASDVSIRGLGQPTKELSPYPYLEAPAFPYYAFYPNYLFDVSFELLPYAVLDDSFVTVSSLEWTDIDGSSKSNQYANEWIRFTEFALAPTDDNVTGIQGSSLQFHTSNSSDGIDGSPFNGQPLILLNNSKFIIKWKQVPIRYMTSPNSFLNAFRGRVNQFEWFEMSNGYMFQPGELLYMNYSPTIYTSPVAQTQSWTIGDTSLIKMMDVDLMFLFTRREGTSLPNDITNANFIPAGHNLNPYFPTRGFYYTQSVPPTGVSTKSPYWYSAPMELLFSDPDSA